MYLNLAKAQELIAEAVKAKGEDYVYPHAQAAGYGSDCKYAEIVENLSDNSWEYVPSCIVGHAFVLGDVMSAADLYDSYYNESGADMLIEEMKENEILEGCDDDALAFLGRVQASQDRARPWGEALKMALAKKAWDWNKGEYVEHDDSYYL